MRWASCLPSNFPRRTARARRLHKNKGRVALARRLLVGVYVSHRKGEPFSLRRCLAA